MLSVHRVTYDEPAGDDRHYDMYGDDHDIYRGDPGDKESGERKDHPQDEAAHDDPATHPTTCTPRVANHNQDDQTQHPIGDKNGKRRSHLAWGGGMRA